MKPNDETWKPVPNMTGVEASSHGRIRLHGIVKPLCKTGKTAKLGKGYLATKMNRKLFKAHRLVALAFHENPTHLPQVNHRDGDSLNNHAENLEWCDNRHNQVHAQSLGLKRAIRGESVGTSKITPDIARKVLELSRDGGSERGIAAIVKISHRQVGRIIKRENWKHIKL